MSLLGVRFRRSRAPLADPATGRSYDEGFVWPEPNFNGALHALEVLSEDPDRTDMIEEFLACTGSAPYRDVFHRVMNSPQGRRILSERRDLLKALEDRETLAQLPRGTLGRDYFEWTEARHFSATALADIISRQSRTFESEAHAFNARVTDMHDLWHVLGGWGSDLYGEMHLLGCSYAQLRNPGWLIIGLLFGFALATAGRLHGIMYFTRAYAIGLRAEMLPAVDWEHMLTLPTTEVRRLVGMPEPRGHQTLSRKEWYSLQRRSPFFHLLVGLADVAKRIEQRW